MYRHVSLQLRDNFLFKWRIGFYIDFQCFYCSQYIGCRVCMKFLYVACCASKFIFHHLACVQCFMESTIIMGCFPILFEAMAISFVVLGLIVLVLLNIYGMTPILIHWCHRLVIDVTILNNVFSGTHYFWLLNIVSIYRISHILPTTIKLVVWTL